MKKYFITGLVILLPVMLTLVVIIFIFNFLTAPFLEFTEATLGHYGIFENGLFFLSADQLQHYVSQILILFTLFFFTVFLGLFARWVFFHYLVRMWDYVLHRIPFVNGIYKAFQDVINTMFTSKTTAFKQVVMVRFPNPDTYTMGLITRDHIPGFEHLIGPNLLLVFVPTTPNPTSGFLTIFKKEDVVYLDMKVEDAFKYIISCGVISTPFKTYPIKDFSTERLTPKPLEGLGEIKVNGFAGTQHE